MVVGRQVSCAGAVTPWVLALALAAAGGVLSPGAPLFSASGKLFMLLLWLGVPPRLTQPPPTGCCGS